MTMPDKHCLSLLLVTIFTTYLLTSGTCKEQHINKRSIHNEVLQRQQIENADTKLETQFLQTSQLYRWTEAAFQYMRTLDCTHTTLTTEKQCRRLFNRKRSQLGVYLAEPSTDGFYGVVMPDDDHTVREDRRHDAVLVLDPFSGADFGHLIMVFYVDLFVDPIKCHLKQGLTLGKSL